MGPFLVINGMLLMAVGFAAEMVAMIGLVSYRLRRILPFQSPLQLHDIGVALLVLGILGLLVGRVLIVD